MGREGAPGGARAAAGGAVSSERRRWSKQLQWSLARTCSRLSSGKKSRVPRGGLMSTIPLPLPSPGPERAPLRSCCCAMDKMGREAAGWARRRRPRSEGGQQPRRGVGVGGSRTGSIDSLAGGLLGRPRRTSMHAPHEPSRTCCLGSGVAGSAAAVAAADDSAAAAADRARCCCCCCCGRRGCCGCCTSPLAAVMAARRGWGLPLAPTCALALSAARRPCWSACILNAYRRAAAAMHRDGRKGPVSGCATGLLPVESWCEVTRVPGVLGRS